uniref:IF rod domain-containing protein n=1 Tax=Meloidogyne incognita TaxID=6306 RepID=A0A914LG32_MELIC
MESLNGTLAGYIEHVRTLENEKTRLEVQINEEFVERKEKGSLATLYKVEIEELRKQLERKFNIEERRFNIVLREFFKCSTSRY